MSEVMKIFYALSDANSGELLESNAGGAELGFVTGKEQVIEALEKELLNMQAGDKKLIKIACADALGQRDESLMQLLPKEQFAGIELKVGMPLIGQDEEGNNVHAIVSKLQGDDVLLDYNHPYAGKDLIFDIHLTERRPADSDEELTGVVKMPHTCCCGGHHHHEHGHEPGSCKKAQKFDEIYGEHKEHECGCGGHHHHERATHKDSCGEHGEHGCGGGHHHHHGHAEHECGCGGHGEHKHKDGGCCGGECESDNYSFER